MLALVIALGLAAAVALAVGFVLQQHAAAEEPPSRRLSFWLLVDLIRRPVWLLGIAAMVVGQVLGAVALGLGDLALVEPLLAANLLFALPLAAAWHRRRLGRREWVGAIALSGGLAGFLAVGSPGGSSDVTLAWPNWVLGCGAVAAAAGLLATAARRSDAAGTTAGLLAAGAGCLYGLQDALTRPVLQTLSDGGVVGVLTSWPAYLLLAIAICGLLLAQSAFEAAPLAASLPAITILEPITGIAFGVGVYGEGLDIDPIPLAVELICLAIAVVGVLLVARSPLVTGAVRDQARAEREAMRHERQAA